MGINGASDAVWREKMRPPRYIDNNRDKNSMEKGRGESFKENHSSGKQERIKPTVAKEQPNKN